MASLTLRAQVGRLFLVGLEGTTLSPLDRAWLRLLRPSGVILFRRNIEDARQTTALLSEATALCGGNVLRAVDLEGGLVDRLRDLLAPMPSLPPSRYRPSPGRQATRPPHRPLCAPAWLQHHLCAGSRSRPA